MFWGFLCVCSFVFVCLLLLKLIQSGSVAQASLLFCFPIEISCGPPSHVPNAIARGVHYQYGDMITYSCYSGYMLEGSLRSVCLESGNWTSPPTCRGKETFGWLFLRETTGKYIWKSDAGRNQARALGDLLEASP